MPEKALVMKQSAPPRLPKVPFAPRKPVVPDPRVRALAAEASRALLSAKEAGYSARRTFNLARAYRVAVERAEEATKQGVAAARAPFAAKNAGLSAARAAEMVRTYELAAETARKAWKAATKAARSYLSATTVSVVTQFDGSFFTLVDGRPPS